MENEGIVPLNNKIFDPNMTNHSIDIYYNKMSPPSRAALITMRALGLKYNLKTINIFNGDHMKPEFMKLNPLHTIPTINDNGFVLYDSNAIMKYLVDQYGKDDSLYPRDPKKGAVVTQRLFSGGGIFSTLVATHLPILRGGNVTEDDKKKLFEYFQYVDNILGDSKWIAGDNMTIADFAIISIMENVKGAGLYDMSPYSNLLQWMQRSANGMSSFGYDEIMQSGGDAFGSLFKKTNN